VGSLFRTPAPVLLFTVIALLVVLGALTAFTVGAGAESACLACSAASRALSSCMVVLPTSVDGVDGGTMVPLSIEYI